MAAGDEADVFAMPDFWLTSRWLETLDESPTPFFPKLLDAEAAAAPDTPASRLVPFAPIRLDRDGFFRLPPLGLAEPCQPDSQPDAHHHVSASADGPTCVEAAGDVWMEPGPSPDKKPGFRTWDAFAAGQPAPHQPVFVSEAGPAAYDALLRWPSDPLGLGNSDVPVVAARTYISSLLALALGRDSVFFHKDDQAASFKPALPAMRISGYSRQLLRGVESQALSCGSAFLQLDAFVRSTYAASSSPSAVALASSIGQVLQAVERRIAVDGRKPRSLLLLQASIHDVSTILTPFWKLVSRLRRACSDEDMLSIVFHTASSLDDGRGCIRDAMREVLRRVSARWVELLEEWIGTKREDGLALTKASRGESRAFVKVEAEPDVDGFGREVEHVDFRLDYTKVPDFMPSDVAESIFETGRNLRFIRSFHPGHPLAQPAVIASMHPPRATWLYDWASILELERRLSRYRDSLRDALEASRRRSLPCPTGIGPRAPESSSAFTLEFFGLDEAGLEERLLASMKQLDEPIAGPKSEDALGRIVRERLSDRSHDAPRATDAADATPHWSLLPVLSFGGIASAQAQVINRESLRLLFDAHHLRGHLRLQRSFHLLGNGMFCSRLSHALFDPDLESAERQAGVARQGGPMGLRLGGRDSWPPASSELRLALMGVLADSYGYDGRPGPRGDGASYKPGSRHGEPGGLPGDLSFAVRDLSPDEMDRCIDADSLEALDFLRLSYKTPPELAAVITPTHLMRYDAIFKLLLRVLRMLYVVNQQYRDINARAGARHRPSNASYRFAREAQHFVSSVASYFLDTGVAVPWQAFERRLDEAQAHLESPEGGPVPEGVGSPDQLRELHSQVLDRIMLALFLRKRQQPVLELLEEMLGTVLRNARRARLEALGRRGETGRAHEAEELCSEFRKKMQVFITVCRGMSEKGRAGGGKAGEALIGDDSLVAQLLVKLDMDGHYCRH